MSDELVRRLELDVAEHKMRLDAIERIVMQQNEALNALTAQLGKLQNRLTVIGTAAVVVIGVSSEHGGLIIRTFLGA